MPRPQWLNGDLGAAMRWPLPRRRFLSLVGAAGLGAYMTAHVGSVPDTFYVRTEEPVQPTFDHKTYRLVVDGLVRRRRSYSYRDLLWLPSTRQTCDFLCIEGWSVSGVPWEGVQLSTLMKLTRPLANARFVTFHCLGDSYSESLSLEEAQMPHALLAYCMYNHPLPPEHGSPLRLVFPGMLGYKSAKWVTRVEFRAERDRGYWERLGASVDPWLDDRDPCSATRPPNCLTCRQEGFRSLIGRPTATPTPRATNTLAPNTNQTGSSCSTPP